MPDWFVFLTMKNMRIRYRMCQERTGLIDKEAIMHLESARFEFKLPDCWIGVFWRATTKQLDIWICVVPCIPFHMTFIQEAE